MRHCIKLQDTDVVTNELINGVEVVKVNGKTVNGIRYYNGVPFMDISYLQQHFQDRVMKGIMKVPKSKRKFNKYY